MGTSIIFIFMHLTIISGRAGAGKSVCLHLLEDLNYYCVDNLPISLLPALIEKIKDQHSQIAVNIDARNLPNDMNQFTAVLSHIRAMVADYTIIFLDAENNILLKRFSETRRKHPLSSTTTPLQEALLQEQHLLEPIAKLADLRIDTSHLTVQQLRELLCIRLVGKENSHRLSLLFESFGYKFGVPLDVDYVFDSRCLVNPYWESNLCQYTGLDQRIIDFLEQQPSTHRLLNDIKNFLETWLSAFETRYRMYLTVAVGCTGGQHRSVYLVEKLAEYFRPLYPSTQVRHREI